MSPLRTGEKTPGIDIEARMASFRYPEWKSTSLLVTMSVATQAKGMGRESNEMESR